MVCRTVRRHASVTHSVGGGSWGSIQLQNRSLIHIRRWQRHIATPQLAASCLPVVRLDIAKPLAAAEHVAVGCVRWQRSADNVAYWRVLTEPFRRAIIISECTPARYVALSTMRYG